MSAIMEMSKFACAMGALATVASGCVAAPSYVTGRISDCGRYESLNPHFKKAFLFMKRNDIARLPPGRYEIDGENCWAMVQEVALTPLEGHKVEAHRRYIDIQTPLTGPETIGLVRVDDEQFGQPFNAKDDYVLFDAKTEPLVLQPGEFAIFFPPTCGHAPGCLTLGGQSLIRKLVIKVKSVEN